MTFRKQLVRKVVSIGVCTAIVFSGFAIGGQAPSASAATKLTKADKVISLGKKYLGVKYRFGAPSGVTTSFDCSSFMQHIFGKNGVKLPRVSSSQALKGVKIAKSKLKRGDLVFFKTPSRTGNKIGHVGVYLGSNKMLHTSRSSKGVAITSMTGYWAKNYVTARRVL